MKIEGRRWHFSAVDDLTVGERGAAVHEISLAMISPPRPLAERKRVAIRQALALFEGSRSGRARLLEGAWQSYISNGWKRESDMESLAYPRSTERALLHRITRLNGGRSLGWRQIDRIAGASVTAARCVAIESYDIYGIMAQLPQEFLADRPQLSRHDQYTR
jgi:hypothetical protein